MRLQESGEMYLETIYTLLQNGQHVRSVDVSEYMGYSKPSVSRAVGILKQDGYVEADEEGFLLLTAAGCQIAEKIYERHHLLTQFFTELGVDEATAAKDACRIEHVVSDATFEAIKKLAISSQKQRQKTPD